MQGGCFRSSRRAPRALLRVQAAAATLEHTDYRATKCPSFPFAKIAGQDEMKLALLLNVVDSNIGGVLVMGDRGTGKSVAVRAMDPAHLSRQARIYAFPQGALGPVAVHIRPQTVAFAYLDPQHCGYCA